RPINSINLAACRHPACGSSGSYTTRAVAVESTARARPAAGAAATSRFPRETADVWIVQTALRRPYTFVVLAVVIAIFGVRAALTTPTDIFPNINIPVVSVVWTYNGLPPNDMSGRIIYFYERYLTAQVANIEQTRIAVAERLRRGESLLPEERRHRRGDRAGDRRLADRAQAS